MDSSLAIPAFIAGILTFLAPCTLPLIPGFLGFISGVSLDDIKNSAKASQARRNIFFNGLSFVIGFSAVFILLGTLAGIVGGALASYRVWLSRIGGIFVILFGLFMLDVVRIPLFSRITQLRVPKVFKRGSLLNSFILGVTFGFGWTPCIGPILGTILTLAATRGTISEGAMLLLIFSLGLAIPFLIISLAIGSAAAYINNIGRYLNIFSIIGGLFLIFLGVLLLTNQFGIWVSWFYKIFNVIPYDRLLNYL